MKCSKCNADITGMDSHICAGSTVAGTYAIEECIEYQKTHSMSYGGHGHTANQGKQELAALVANQIPEDCVWTEEESSEYWHTKCGNDFCFIDSGPKENGMKYCPCCGGKILVEEAQ